MERKAKKARRDADRISALPNELLAKILSSGLAMKEAAKTSVLAHRWRNLWKLYSVILDFGAREMEASRSRDWVNQVLELHESPTVERLRIAFDPRYGYSRDITKWIDFAIVKRVERLEIDLNGVVGCCWPSKCSAYTFPTWLMDIPLDFPCFDRLKALCLKSVSISEEDLAYFLSTCQLLEELSLEDAASIQNVRVSGQSLKLKHLEIRFCLKLENLEVSEATSLASFKYAGHHINMCFGDVPLLSSVSLEMLEEGLTKFALQLHRNLNLSRMQRLELDLGQLRTGTCFNFPRHFPEFSNLEQLQLKFVAIRGDSLLFLSSIVGAAPHLRRLTMKYSMRPRSYRTTSVLDPSEFEDRFSSCEKRWEEEAGRYSYGCLKGIVLVGWVGVENDVQLANYLLDRAFSLEKITVDLRCPHHNQTSWDKNFLPRDGERDVALSNALQLERRLAPGAKFIIL